MNINTLLGLFTAAAQTNAALISWATTNYSVHSVYQGIDIENPPGESNYPMIYIAPDTKEVGYDLDKKGHNITVICGLVDTATTATTIGTVVLNKYTGVENLESFRKLVETAIVSAIDAYTTTKLWMNSLSIEYETLDMFPFFLCSMSWQIDEEYYQSDGSDIFT
uniref:Uncharacterized protein n=1 Tax=viral metagenome TaxID=1070528 RepID=A0A6M3INF4_9ZZZZ